MLRTRRFSFYLILTFVATLLIYIHTASDSAGDLADETFDAEPIKIRLLERPEQYPLSSIRRLPGNAFRRPVPRIQHDFGSSTGRAGQASRRKAVRKSFKHSWKGYKKYAWLKDELLPVTGGFNNPFGSWAATLIDSLDTLWILDMKADFEQAVRAVDQIDFSSTEMESISVFETTIRYLGGLLGAYDVSESQYPSLLTKAEELGEILYLAFDTPNRMPVTRLNFQSYSSGASQRASMGSSVAELGSLSVELTRLSQLTGNNKYFDAVQRITDVFDKEQSRSQLPGLWPVLVNAEADTFGGDNYFTLGAMADSVYEYLPKQYLMLGGASDQLKAMYEGAIEAATKYLFYRPMTKDGSDCLLTGDAAVDSQKRVRQEPRTQHLTCFVGGMVAMGARIFGRQDDLDIAKKLVNGCMWAYRNTQTGIMPEIFSAVPCEKISECAWNETRWHLALGRSFSNEEGISANDLVVARGLDPGFTSVPDRRYLLRPEAIESIFILYRITGDESLRDQAWKMFQAIDKHCRTKYAYASLADVTASKPQLVDNMESFWLAETLKYFYLIFSPPDLISLDEYVLNTEAHPFRRSNQSIAKM